MKALFKALLGISFQRLGPEHLPDSSFLLKLTIAAYIGANLGAASLGKLSPIMTISIVLFDAAFIAAIIFGVLMFVGLQARFRQTASATYGTLTILQVIALPLAVVFRALDPESVPYLVLGIGIWIVWVWQVIVFGHILARALDQPYMIGIAVSLGYVMLNVAVMNLMLSTATGA